MARPAERIGLPATGRQATLTGSTLGRSCTIVEHWGGFDRVRMLQDLGALPVGQSLGQSTPRPSECQRLRDSRTSRRANSVRRA
jgi:hypothetical protein